MAFAGRWRRVIGHFRDHEVLDIVLNVLWRWSREACLRARRLRRPLPLRGWPPEDGALDDALQTQVPTALT